MRRGGVGEVGYLVLFVMADGGVRTLTEVYCALPSEPNVGLSTVRAAVLRLIDAGYLLESRHRPEWAREGPWYLITPNGQAAAKRRARSLRYLLARVNDDDA